MIGGDIVEITYNHPTLGSGTFSPKSGEDSTYDLGGFRTSDDSAMLSSDGQNIKQINRRRWMFQVLCTWDMNDQTDLENAVSLAGDPIDADWTFTNINGTTYAGKGSVVGEPQGNGNNSTFPLNVSGGGDLVKIAG